MDGYFRFSYATDEKSIEEGIKRIKIFAEKKYNKFVRSEAKKLNKNFSILDTNLDTKTA